MRASRLRVSTPTVTNMRTCVQPVLHTSLSCKVLLLFISDTSPGIQSSIVLSVANWPTPSSPASNLTHYPQKQNTLIHCSLPSPSLSSLCRLHYSPLIVKSFCSISTHPFYKHTLLIFLICIHFKSRSTTFCLVVQFFWKCRNHLTSGLLKYIFFYKVISNRTNLNKLLYNIKVINVDYCDVFISCLDSHSDGTHSLQRIHLWASDVLTHFSKSVLMKKQTHLHFGFRAWGWVHFSQNVMFGWTIALTAFEKFIKL